MHVIFVTDTVNENNLVVPIEERLGVEALATVIMNFDSDSTDEYG